MSAVFSGVHGTYRIIRQLGQGGFGQAHLAEANDGRQVVVKLLHMSRVPDWKSVELFHREARVLQRLDHARIPGYIDHGPDLPQGEVPDDGQFFIVQQYIEGTPLDQFFKEPLSALQAVSVLRDILDVLDYLHGRDPAVIHRDVKPGNIILDPNNRAHLIDFGTVTAALRADMGSTTAGTFGYAAPEQFVGRANPSSDLYGLGMTLVAVLAGQEPQDLPFRGNRVDVEAALESRQVDARLRLLFKQMTDPNPDTRTSTAHAARARLAGLDAAERSTALLTGPADTTAAARWLEARHRLDTCKPLDGPQHDSYNSSSDTVFDASGRWLFFPGYTEKVLVRLEDLHVFRLPDYDEPFAGFSADGRTLVVFDRGAGSLDIYDAIADGDMRYETVPTAVFSGDFSSFGIDVAVSPDAQMFAVTGNIHDDMVRLVDRKGTVFQNFQLEGLEQVFFTPDGASIVLLSYNFAEVHGVDGSKRKVDCREIAFSPDGAIEAIRRESVVEIRRTETGYLNEANPTVTRLRTGAAENISFSPDSSQLIFTRPSEGGNEIVICDATTFEVAQVIRAAGRPHLGRSVERVQLSRNGAVAWVIALEYWMLGTDDTFWGTGAFDTATGEPIGLLVNLETSHGYTSAFISWEGFECTSDATSEPATIARALFTGRRVDLDEPTRAAWEDLRERYRFVAELFAEEVLNETDNPAEFLRVSKGLTYLLPAIAKRASGDGPARFGPGDRRVNAASLAKTGREVHDMPQDLKDALFDEMIADLSRKPTPAKPEPVALVQSTVEDAVTTTRSSSTVLLAIMTIGILIALSGILAFVFLL